MTHTFKLCHGFECGDLYWPNSYSGTISVQQSIVRNSLWALKIGALSGGTGSFNILGEGISNGNCGTWVDNNVNYSSTCAFHLYIETLPTSGNRMYLFRHSDATINRRSISIKDDGKVEMRGEGSPGSVEATSTGAMVTGKWYAVTIFATSASFRFIARDAETSETVVDVSGTASATNRYVNIGAYWASYGTIYIDNFCWESSSSGASYVDDPINVLTVRFAVNRQIAAGEGYYDDWNGDYTSVDDTPPHDGDTTYIETTTNGAVVTKTLSSIASFPVAPGTIELVMCILYHRGANLGSNPWIRTRVRSNTTDYASTNEVGNVSGTYVQARWYGAVDPATSSAWTQSGVDALQFGAAKGATASRAYITLIMTEVLYSSYIVNRIPKVTYAVDVGDAMQTMMEVNSGQTPDLAEIPEDVWTAVERLGLPTAETPPTFMDRDDLLYHEEVVYTQAIGETPSVEISPSTFNFVEAMISRLTEPSGSV